MCIDVLARLKLLLLSLPISPMILGRGRIGYQTLDLVLPAHWAEVPGAMRIR